MVKPKGRMQQCHRWGIWLGKEKKKDETLCVRRRKSKGLVRQSTRRVD